MRIEAFSLDGIGGAPYGAVRALLIWGKLCDRQGFPVELHRHRGVKRLIFGNERIFLLHKSDDLRLERPCRDFKIAEEKLSEVRFQLSAERGREHFLEDLLDFFLHDGRVFIHKIVFRRIEFVAGIDRMTHGCKRRRRHEPLFKRVRRLIRRDLLFGALCIVEPCGDRIKIGKHPLHVRAHIRHFRKFHSSLRSPPTGAAVIFS